MARPTTWRRSFNVGGFLSPEGAVDLLTVQPGETLGGTWWQYSLRSIGNVTSNTEPPLSNAVTVVGLVLADDGQDPAMPLAQPFAPWLWWEMATYDHLLVNMIDFAYMNSSNTGGTQRKVQAMRKNEGTVGQVLWACWQTFQGSAEPAEVAFSFEVACSALIILP